MLTFLILIITSTSVMASTENELLLILTKNFSEKEISVSNSLCKEYSTLYSSLTEKEKLQFKTMSCPRVEPTVDAESKSAKYLESINAQINVIKNTSNTISDNEVKLIVDQMFANK